jgi:hydroxymethylbilane synthase
MPGAKLRIGTRGSKLARWQAEWVAGRLSALGRAVEILEIATRGDVEQSGPIGSIGATGIFTKEIQRALLNHEIDVAVHSLKDLPTEAVDGLTLAAVPERESAADVLVVRSNVGTLDALPKASRVGTGSVRRQAQLRHLRPDLEIADIRGNVDTRLRKLDEGLFDALVLAEAGLRRLGLEGRVAEVLPFSVMLPAVGQGALGIETRADDTKSRSAVSALDDAATHVAVTAERALLARLLGGCLAPVGARGHLEGGALCLSAAVLSTDGVERIAANDRAAPAQAEALGRRVADSLLARGAESLIDASKSAQKG